MWATSSEHESVGKNKRDDFSYDDGGRTSGGARRLLPERASRVILAAAVIDEVFGFIVLSVVSAVAREQVRVIELVLSGALAAGFTVIVTRWGTRAVTQIVPRLQTRLRSGEVQFKLAMFTLFGLALLASYTVIARSAAHSSQSWRYLNLSRNARTRSR